MLSYRRISILAVLGLSGIFLGGLWLALPDRGQAAERVIPAGSPRINASIRQEPDSPPSPDPAPAADWLRLVQGTTKGESSQTLGPVTMHLDMTGGYVAGRVPTGLPVDIHVLQEGTLVADITVQPVLDQGSFFYYGRPLRQGSGDPCLGGCFPYVMEEGDEIQVIQAGASLSMTVPTLSALADSDADQVYGEAPPSAPVRVYLFPETPAGPIFTQTVSADSQGDYWADWSSSLDIRPLDGGYTAYAQDMDRQAYIRFFAPFLRMQIGAYTLSGIAAPNVSVAITVTNQTGEVIAHQYDNTGSDGRFGPFTWFIVPFRFAPGYQVHAAAGGQVFSATAGAVSALSDLSSGRIIGRADPGSSLAVLRHAGPLLGSRDGLWLQPPAEIITTVADTAGDYHAVLALEPGNYGAAVWTDARGHQTYARYAVPQHHVLLGDSLEIPWDSLLWGQVDAPGAAFTVAVKGPSGYLKDLILPTAEASGAYVYEPNIWPPSYLVIESGDVLTVTIPNGVEFSATLPQLTVLADPDSEMVSGLAPPNAILTVRLTTGHLWRESQEGHLVMGGGGGGYPPEFELSLVVTATAQGTYEADFGPLGGFDLLAYGEVEIPLSAGHSAARRFRGLNACPLVPYRVEVGLNILELYGAPDCMDGLVRLRDAQGSLKAETYFFSEDSYLYIELYDNDGFPARILPGDIIEVVAEGSTVTEVVPNLTVHVDSDLNQVTGEAPAGQDLWAVISEQSHPYGLRVVTTTATTQGLYLFDLDGLLTLNAGDRVDVFTRHDLPIYNRTGGLPFLDVRLYDWSLYGWLPPLTPYTLTYLAPGAPTQIISGWSSLDGTVYGGGSLIQPGVILELTTADLVWPMTVPDLTVDFDQTSGVITGLAPPSTTLVVEVWDANSYFGVELHTTAESNGTYTFDDPFLAFIQEPDGTLYQFDALGNRTALEFSWFAWEVWLGQACVSGRGATSATEVELTLESPEGLYQEAITSTVGSYYGEFYGCFQRAVQGGSRLVFDDGRQIREFDVPVLEALYHRPEQVIVGEGPANAIMKVEVDLENYQRATRQVQANGTGRFGLDLSDLTLNPWGYGLLLYEDQARNAVYLEFSQANHAYLPWVAD